MDYSQFEAQNVFHFCPRCGSNGFSVDAEKKFTCAACDFVFYINACGTVVGVVNASGGRIVLTVRDHEPAAGTLDLPGGFIDLHETAEEALRREMREELNLDVTQSTYICSMPNLYVYKDILYHTIDFFYLCQVSNLDEIQSREEVRDIRIVKLMEIDLNEIGFQSIRRGIGFLRQAVEMGEIVL